MTLSAGVRGLMSKQSSLQCSVRLATVKRGTDKDPAYAGSKRADHLKPALGFKIEITRVGALAPHHMPTLNQPIGRSIR